MKGTRMVADGARRNLSQLYDVELNADAEVLSGEALVHVPSNFLLFYGSLLCILAVVLFYVNLWGVSTKSTRHLYFASTLVLGFLVFMGYTRLTVVEKATGVASCRCPWRRRFCARKSRAYKAAVATADKQRAARLDKVSVYKHMFNALLFVGLFLAGMAADYSSHRHNCQLQVRFGRFYRIFLHCACNRRSGRIPCTELQD